MRVSKRLAAGLVLASASLTGLTRAATMTRPW